MLQRGDRVFAQGMWATVGDVAGKDVVLDFDTGGFSIGPWADGEPAKDAPPVPTLDPELYTDAALRAAIVQGIEVPSLPPHDPPWFKAASLATNAALALSDGAVGRPGEAFTKAIAELAAVMTDEGLLREKKARAPRRVYSERAAYRSTAWLTPELADAAELARAEAVANLRVRNELRRVERAQDAYQEALDREFGRCSIPNLFVRSLAAGIEALRDRSGSLDHSEVKAFVTDQTGIGTDSGDLDPHADAAAVSEWLEEILDAIDPDEYESLLEHVGSVDSIAGADSSSFAVMTASACTVNVVSRNGQLATYSSGGMAIEMGDAYNLEAEGAEADDPDLRDLRLRTVARFFGLGPGVWVDGQEELDRDLREMTIAGEMWTGWWDGVRLEQDRDELIADYLDVFAAMLVTEGKTNPARAAAVLEQLIEGRQPAAESERQIVWEIWKDRRPVPWG